MQCSEFEDRWNALLDGRSDPARDPLLSAHADRCPPCRELLAGQVVWRASLASQPLPPLSAGFAHDVVRAAVIEKPSPVRRTSRLFVVAAGTLLATSAAALLAVSLFWFSRGSQPVIADQPAPTPAGRVDRTGVNNTAKRRAPAQFRGGGNLALAQGNWLAEMPRLGDHVLDGIDDLADAFPETVERLDEAARLSPGIRPLRLSFALLWDTFFRALPSVRNPDTAPPPRDGTTRHQLDMLQMA